MQRPDSIQYLPSDFNQAFLCCLPKKVSGHDAAVGDYYDPQNTRPLSLVNTDNRLIANAYRLVIEPLANEWVSKMQQGFLQGRSLLGNVVDIDFATMRVSLRHRRGMLVLFDFEAAFPSMSQEFLMESLRVLEFPPEVLQAISCLYTNNQHILKLKGGCFPSITATSGVRQGCPLSPLLFVICVDALLRRLESRFPDCCIRAYADDNAMVVTDFLRDGRALLAIYKEFEAVSNLKLNLPKTVLIPLWPCKMQEWKGNVLHDALPEWCRCDVATWSRYLGFAVGPGRDNHSWDKPLEKYRERAKLWSQQHLGMHYAAHSYNAFTLPTLSFVWQLENVPEYAFQEEDRILRSLTKGPGKWRISSDLYHLHQHFGQARSFKSVEHVALAAKLRLFVLGGLQIQERVFDLRRAQHQTDFLDRVVCWNSWYDSSYPLTLYRANDHAKSHGVDASVVFRVMRLEDPYSARKKLQQVLESQLLSTRSLNVNCDERLRHKTRRWHLTIPLGIACRRINRRLQAMQQLSTPRVQSAVFKTLWNGWTTAARFQSAAPCVLGCSATAEDRIEHYCHCHFARELLVRWMGLRESLVSLPAFLLALPDMSDTDITLVSVVVYAMFRATSHFRHYSGCPDRAVVVDYLQQMCQNAVMGHRSTKVLDQATRWRHCAGLSS